jgi:hypothetical protein
VTSRHVEPFDTDGHSSESVELYFYGELNPVEQEACERHLAACGRCRDALGELAAIRAALAARPDISAPAGGDWSVFMSRLDRAIEEDAGPPDRRQQVLSASTGRPPYAAYLAMAALLTLVTISLVFVMRSRTDNPLAVQGPAGPAAADARGDRRAFHVLSEEHFERSKLVVLGLVTKDAGRATARDWTYERELASTLLPDTRMYRLAAEDHGLQSLAGVMNDLEVVLLQASFTDETDSASLAQIQRLIRKRDLLEKMEAVNDLGTEGS